MPLPNLKEVFRSALLASEGDIIVVNKKNVPGSESELSAVVSGEAGDGVDENSDAFLLGNIALQ
ncbi:hypothetical protein ABZ128_32135 [Streptomyces sp. NPDC006326]|uniref:hypothetical protein n=1 Tax=Streptomyces sp. NPDC006326 TaxID=3156752 RepID=UPI0033A3228E